MCDVRHSRYNEPITAIIGKCTKRAMNGSKKNERRGAAIPLSPQAARSKFFNLKVLLINFSTCESLTYSINHT